MFLMRYKKIYKNNKEIRRKTIPDVINNYENLNVLIIGETIIDSNCEVMENQGKTSSNT